MRGGAGTALVGSHAQVADLIEEYAALGISEFILSGYPHLEEAFWFGEEVLPELRAEHGCPLGHPLCGPRAPTASTNWRLAGMASAERQLHFPH